MNDKELNELLEYNLEYMDARLSEDVFGGDYTSEVELKHLEKAYDKLQSNWNSLREIIKDLGIDYLLDKMNELEGADNVRIMGKKKNKRWARIPL